MFSAVLSADIAYAEIAFFGIIVLGLLLGIIRGFAKSFKGFFLSIAIMLCALLLISPTFARVRSLDMFMNMESSLTKKIEDGDEIFSTPITVIEDESGSKTYWTTVQKEGVETTVPLEEGMGEGMVSSVKGKLAKWLAERFISEDGQTIGSVAGIFVSDIITAVIMFVAYCIILHLICYLLRKIFNKLHHSDSKLLKGIDRTCGAIVSALFAFVFVLVALAIIYAIRDKIPEIDEMISSSSVCGYFYANNPIAKLFTEIFG